MFFGLYSKRAGDKNFSFTPNIDDIHPHHCAKFGVDQKRLRPPKLKSFEINLDEIRRKRTNLAQNVIPSKGNSSNNNNRSNYSSNNMVCQLFLLHPTIITFSFTH